MDEAQLKLAFIIATGRHAPPQGLIAALNKKCGLALAPARVYYNKSLWLQLLAPGSFGFEFGSVSNSVETNHRSWSCFSTHYSSTQRSIERISICNEMMAEHSCHFFGDITLPPFLFPTQSGAWTQGSNRRGSLSRGDTAYQLL